MISLFTKSYYKDFEWLSLAIRSIFVLCKEDVEWTIVTEKSDFPQLESLLAAHHNVVQSGKIRFRTPTVEDLWPEAMEIPTGYMRQQWIKMNPHRSLNSGLFWHWDSDVIALKGFDQFSFRNKNGKPIYWISQFNSFMDGGPNDNIHRGRMAVMREVIGIPEPSIEYMRCFPIPGIVEISKAGSLRSEWSRSFEKLKNGDSRFSEFNIMGLFSNLYFPEAFDWRNAEASGPTFSGGYANGAFQEHAIVTQSWSYGGIPDHIRNFVSKL